MASSNTLDDHVVTRASIILEKQSNWKLWYSMKKQFATIKGVWEYCDPSTTTQPPVVDSMPSNNDSDGVWRKWEIKTASQKATLKAIGKVNLEIMRTVARSKLHLITKLDLSVRLRLKTLQDHFQIITQQEVLELSSQYTAVQQKPKSQNVDTWLNEYSRIVSLCQSEDIAEMKGTRPQWAFIQAIQAQGDSDWSGQHFAIMISCEEDNKDPPTLKGLINRYRQWISTRKIHINTLSSFAAQDTTQSTQVIAQSDNPKNREKCVCGLDHDLLKCFILNQEAEGCPEDYEPNRIGLRKILRAFKNPEVLQNVKELFQDSDIPWTFNSAEASAAAEAQNRSENPTQESDSGTNKHRSNADQLDDDINEAPQSGDYYANNAFHLAQTAPLTGNTTLFDRRFVNPDSVCLSTLPAESSAAPKHITPRGWDFDNKIQYLEPL